MEHDIAAKTIADFGEQWLSFRDNPGYYGSAKLLADIFGSLLTVDELVGARIADIGSGTGRIVNMLLDARAKHVYAVEPSAAMAVYQAGLGGYRASCAPLGNRYDRQRSEREDKG